MPLPPTRRLAGFLLAVPLAYVVYQHGLWEPLRTYVVTATAGLVAGAALLVHRRQQRTLAGDRSHLVIALAAAALVSWKWTTVSFQAGLDAWTPVLLGAGGVAAAGAGLLHWRDSRRPALERGDGASRLLDRT